MRLNQPMKRVAMRRGIRLVTRKFSRSAADSELIPGDKFGSHGDAKIQATDR